MEHLTFVTSFSYEYISASPNCRSVNALVFLWGDNEHRRFSEMDTAANQ